MDREEGARAKEAEDAPEWALRSPGTESQSQVWARATSPKAIASPTVSECPGLPRALLWLLLFGMYSLSVFSICSSYLLGTTKQMLIKWRHFKQEEALKVHD